MDSNSLQVWLEMLPEPAFAACGNRIEAVNSPAKQLFLSPGDDLSALFLAGQEEYDAFTCGCICMSLHICGHPWSAAVTRTDGFNLFRLESLREDSLLRSYALAARSLRLPLSTVMRSTNSLFASLKPDTQAEKQMEKINQGLYQLLRQVSNMSDAYQYASAPQQGMELGDLTWVLREVLEKCQAVTQEAGRKLEYTLPQDSCITRMNRSLLERAVCNLLSNALKFSSEGSCLHFSFQRSGALARLTLYDPEAILTSEMLATLHRRYTRQPGLEDPRQGTGLGLVLARCAAIAHGGTLLLAPDSRGGTRYCLTLQLNDEDDGVLRDHIQMDYAGNYDHILVELSDVLPSRLYGPKQVND